MWPCLTRQFFCRLCSLYKVLPGDCLLESFHPLKSYLISLESHLMGKTLSDKSKSDFYIQKGCTGE